MTTDKSKNFFWVSAEDFKKIPGNPISYWLSNELYDAYSNNLISSIAFSDGQILTGNNDKYLRLIWEVNAEEIKQRNKWVLHAKGGEQRRWYGNLDTVVSWTQEAISHYKQDSIARFPKDEILFRKGITWSLVSSSDLFSMRLLTEDTTFNKAAATILFYDNNLIPYILAFLNTKITKTLLGVVNPTLNTNIKDILGLPINFKKEIKSIAEEFTNKLVSLSKYDWDSYETSWDFQMNPLCVSPQERAEQLSYGIHSEERAKAVSLISERYMRLRWDWQQQTVEMRNLEIENNRIFIDAYGLQDELSPEVPWNEITLTCNPWYRYGKKPEDMDLLGNSFYMNISEGKVMPSSKQEEDCPAGDFPFAAETEQRLLEDTIKEFISYTVGCMMGRYSPEKPGLILANQGSTVDDYAKIMSNFDKHLDAGDLIEQTTTVYGPEDYIEKSFYGTRYHQIIDADGVLPILDEEWFVDDIVTQFKNFVAFIFGKENLTANMDFIEVVLGKDIRKYFVKDFYKEHIQRYKKRPIYWLFSSPKGSFNALIYLHRYTPDTVSIVLNEYLRELMTKISTRIKHLIEENNRADISNADKTRNLKQIDKYTAQLAELEDYERDVVFPLAQQKIAIDLDDGVKVNYCKFGAALKKIPGLEAKEE